MKVSIIGIDLAKDVFQVAALNRAGKEVMNRCVRRNKLLDVVRQFEPTFLAIEACGSSHYWGRVFRRMGHDVHLIPPQHVKPFTRVNKTDAGDALAICEAAQRPKMHFVAIKSIPGDRSNPRIRADNHCAPIGSSIPRSGSAVSISESCS